MRTLYYRKQRASIYHPATIGDIPQEVLRKAFIYLLPCEADLIALSESCRAWKPVAQELIHSRQVFGKDRKVEKFLCGFQLQSLVFGMGNISINRLEIEIKFVGRENAVMLAREVASSLSILQLDFEVSGDESSIPALECYEIANAYFHHCHGIRSLRLFGFDFGDDPESISPTIKEGFGRLWKLYLASCRGDICKFVENTPILNLETVKIYENEAEFEDEFIDSSEIVNAIASNYRTIINFDLYTCYISTPSLLNIVECCPRVERITFDIAEESPVLQRSDIEALASLPRLNHLCTWNSVLSSDVLSSLPLLKGLKHLGIRWDENLAEILPVLGKKLVSLDINRATADAWMVLYESCPNLQYLRSGTSLAEETLAALNGGLKKKMKRLASFKVNDVSVRLGTDWAGYKKFSEEMEEEGEEE
jgi:hypothetical protein